VTKSKTIEQLVKQRVTKNDPIASLIQPDLRHVSTAVSLDELARILTRNKFALVNKTKFVTTSDLLKKISPAKGGCCSKPCGKKADGSAASEGSGDLMKMTAAAIIGMGVAAVGTFLAMKSKN
jgi:hypothetical protein